MNDLSPAIFKFVEHELYNFDSIKKDLKELKVEIAESSLGNIDYSEPLSTNATGSATEAAAMNVINNKVAIRATKTINAIERTIKKMNEDKSNLFHLKYERREPWQSITMELNISRATYFRYRKEIVKKAAAEMGLYTT